jgi:hypothetical protein
VERALHTKAESGKWKVEENFVGEFQGKVDGVTELTDVRQDQITKFCQINGTGLMKGHDCMALQRQGAPFTKAFSFS